MTRKPRDLTPEEQLLWNRIAQTIEPLKPETRRESQPSPKNPTRNLTKKEPTPLSPPLTPQDIGLPSPSNHRINRIRKVTIEARLDLHGLTRDQAWRRLAQFLASCQKHQILWVLIITGKGGRKHPTEDHLGLSPKPTLRELVPQWLEDPALRSVVSAYATAKQQDGGTGALYVRLKRLVF